MSDQRVQPPPWRDVFQGSRGRLVIGLLLLEAMVAVYSLVITTIMPAVETDLGGLNLYGFAFTVWSLATIITIPIAGHAADRYGPRRPLVIVMGVQICGLAMSAFSPTMPSFIAGLFLQGCAGGALYAVSLGTVAKTFPEEIRARVMALLATMWILPGLFGPPLGAFIATTVGWRWAFVIPVPLLAFCAWLVLPALGRIPPGREDDRIPVRWALQLAIGMGIVLGGLTAASGWAALTTVIGLAVGVPALRHIVPKGTLVARRGLPAAAASMFLLSGAFFTVDAFIPKMLTDLRGMSLWRASVVITLATVTWSIGSWWQSRAATRIQPGVLVTLGTVFVTIGIVGVTAGLAEAPIAFVYVGWTLAGLGMGIAFPTIPLAVMGASEEGKEAGQLSSALLMDTLGMAIGSGLGGASIAIATAHHAGEQGLKTGIAGAYALGFVAALFLLVIARRIPSRVQTDA